MWQSKFKNRKKKIKIQLSLEKKSALRMWKYHKNPAETLKFHWNLPHFLSAFCSKRDCRSSHVQGLLGFGGFVLGAVAHNGVPLRQVEVECDQGAVLHAQGPQSGAVNLKTQEIQLKRRISELNERNGFTQILMSQVVCDLLLSAKRKV